MLTVCDQGFGITIGSDLFYVIDRPARRASHAAAAAANSYVTLTGTFSPLSLVQSADTSVVNSSTPLIPFNGTFTFSNATTDSIASSLQQGSVICSRDPSWPWWKQNMPPIYLIALVPLFSLLLSMWNMQPLRSRQLPVMVVISCIGFLTNTLANHYIFDRSDVVSAIGAFVIGYVHLFPLRTAQHRTMSQLISECRILGNIYSRVFGGTAFTSMVTGVLFLVPVSVLLVAESTEILAHPAFSPFFCISLEYQLQAVWPCRILRITVIRIRKVSSSVSAWSKSRSVSR